MIGTYIANMPKNTVFFIVKYRIYLNIALKTPHKEQGGGRKRL